MRRSTWVSLAVLAVLASSAVTSALAGGGHLPAASASTATPATTPTQAEPHATLAIGPGPRGRIKHIVVVYQENHSFDETLGKFCVDHHNRCDGYIGKVHMANGVVAPMKKSPDIVPNVWHTVLAQTSAVDGGKMDGWNNVTGCNPPRYPRSCLTYYTPKQIPSLASLAAHYVVSDRTFSMYNSPSWGGHLYPAAATQDNFTGDLPYQAPGPTGLAGWGCDSKLVATWNNPSTHKASAQPSCIPARPGQLDPGKFPYRGAYKKTKVKWVPTIFDRLDAKHLSWTLYSSTHVWAICPSFADCRYTKQFDNITYPARILTDAQNGTLPAYSVLLPEGPGSGTDQHNGNSMLRGDNWIGQVLKSLQHSPEWSSTAVFITYDDCGCFYDHVPPGKNADGSEQGIRVPMVIASPYTKVGFTDHHAASFASILKFAEETFDLPALSKNDNRAYDYRASFDFKSPPTGPRAVLANHAVSAASRQYLAAHPSNPDKDDDPT